MSLIDKEVKEDQEALINFDLKIINDILTGYAGICRFYFGRIICFLAFVGGMEISLWMQRIYKAYIILFETGCL